MVRRGTRTPNLWIAGPLLWMLKEFVLISFIKPDVHKTLNIINLWHVDNIIIKL